MEGHLKFSTSINKPKRGGTVRDTMELMPRLFFLKYVCWYNPLIFFFRRAPLNNDRKKCNHVIVHESLVPFENRAHGITYLNHRSIMIDSPLCLFTDGYNC